MSYDLTDEEFHAMTADEQAEYGRHVRAEMESERRAEFAMDWVMGGGHSDDIGAAYIQMGR